MIMYLDGHLLLAKMNLTKQAYQVLYIMLSYVEYSNVIDITQAEIAKVLGIPQSSVCRSIKILLKEKAIRLIGNKGSCNIYEFNPEIGFRGGMTQGQIKASKYKQHEEWLKRVSLETGEYTQ